MRRISTLTLAVVAALVLWLAPGTALAAPSVVLSDPANGALISGGQPTFSGSASFGSNDTNQVTVNVYSGTSASGVPVQVRQAGVTNAGAFSVSGLALPDGTYTALAIESDTSGGAGSSQPITFQLFNAQAQLTLAAPPAPIQTAAPTFTGTALTASGDSATAYLTIYAGSSTNATPVAVLGGPISAGGTFSIPVVPGLAPGAYTAVASQQLALGDTFSPSVAFTISSTAASLTVTSPAPGASEPQTGVGFGGTAGAAYGDSATIDLALYRGGSASGTPVGTESVTRNGTSWSETWPTSLALGTYTLRVTQDNVVNSPTTVTHTFTVVPPGSVTGTITISASGRLTARLSCLSGAGTCAGNVLIVTQHSFRPTYGGPLGPLSLMFERYSVVAAQTRTLTAQLTRAQLSALRKAGASKLKVTVAYSVAAKLTESTRTTAAVKVG